MQVWAQGVLNPLTRLISIAQKVRHVTYFAELHFWKKNIFSHEYLRNVYDWEFLSIFSE